MAMQGGIALRSVAAAALAAIVAIAMSATRRRAFDRHIAGEVDDLFAASTGAAPTVVTEETLAQLPEPVQRWLRWSGVVERACPRTVRLKQEGELLLGGGKWTPFTAEEYYTTEPPGFVWTARITVSRLVTVLGRDAYLGGRGSLDMRFLGLFTVARDSGPAMDRGDLLRYLNELMWFPAGAISPYITWDAIDATSTRATITYGGVSAPATFVFDTQGRLTTMVADRFDRDDGRVNPWSTPVTAYGVFDGVRIPVAGAAVYTRASGDVPYIRARIKGLEYNRPERWQPR